MEEKKAEFTVKDHSIEDMYTIKMVSQPNEVTVIGEEGLQSLINMIRASWESGGDLTISGVDRVVFKRGAAKKTLVNVILDKSGSMSVIRTATIDGFNEYLSTLKRQENTSMTLTLFDSASIDVLYNDRPIEEVSNLNTDTYVPNSTTPLYDAIGQSIRAIEEKHKFYSDKPNVLCVIITDGEENASREYTRDMITKLIKEKEDEGWTFAYLGANQDAWAVGGGMGMYKGNTANFVANSDGVMRAFSRTINATNAYYASGGAPTTDFFKDDE